MSHIVEVSKEVNSKVFGFKDADYNLHAMQVGGMCTFDMTSAMWENIVAHCGVDSTSSVFQHGMTSYILVYTDYMEEAGLNEVEYNAILLHEKGHIHLKHNVLNLGKTGIVCDATQELQADAYAADRVGRAVMYSAIVKICNQVILDLVSLHNSDFDSAYEFIMGNSVLKMRLSALRP